MEKKKYSIAQLASILTISEVAIRKKIIDKRYKKRYDVVEETLDNKSVKFILLDDVELQQEIEISKKNKMKFTGQSNVEQTQDNVIENVDYIDITPEIQQTNDFYKNEYVEFTKRYIEDLKNVYETLDATRQNAVENEKKIYLLEDIEKRKDGELRELEASTKTLQAQKKRYLITIIVMIVTLCAVTSVMSVLLVKANNKPPKVIETQKVIEKPVVKYVKKR